MMTEADYSLTISLIVPVHSGGEKFKQCINSILNIDDTTLETIIVADGESDGAWRYALEKGLTVINLPKSVGPARARNTGATQAEGDILLFIDADITVRPDIAIRVKRAFKENPDQVALFGSYDDEPYEKNVLSQYRNLLHHFVHQTSRKEASTFWTGCGAIQRRIFLDMGGFNEKYRFPSIEDIEFGYRLTKAGYHIGLHKDIQVKHLKYWDACSILRTDFYSRAIPWTELILTQDLFLNDLNLKTADRISVACALAFIFSLSVAWIQPQALFFSFFCASILGILNIKFYTFLTQKRSFLFLAQTLPWHWLYFAQSGLAFFIGYTIYKINK